MVRSVTGGMAGDEEGQEGDRVEDLDGRVVAHAGDVAGVRRVRVVVVVRLENGCRRKF